MIKKEIQTLLSGINGIVRFDEPMRLYTSFRIGGPADAYVEPADVESLQQLMAGAYAEKIPVFVMGGTNLLVRDGGIEGIVVRLVKLNRIEEQEGGLLYAEGGVLMPRLLKVAMQRGLTGLEFAAGIPGTVAGCVVMNAGTRFGEMKEVVRKIRLVTMTGAILDVSGEEAGYSYRRSRLPEGVVVGAWLGLQPGTKAKIESSVKDSLHRRKTTQPIEMPNAGCVFKNPQSDSAGRLIEAAGLKGARIGDAQVSTKHANFIVNRGHATAKDTQALIGLVGKTVVEKFGVALELEVQIVGRESGKDGLN
ncbi:MAG TPA: UDP-N-acetylmuramate dehydrogenase [Nitrospirales bacterium]|jgi:UDP-N-acetylmuramate dehydrogenase